MSVGASKRINSAADLAVNGAPPAFDKPLHVGQPNIGDVDKFLGLTRRLLESGRLSNDGPLVREFEARIAQSLGVENCVAVCNGTVGLEILIKALGMDGEVIVPSYTFVATAHAIHWLGGTPVFADISAETHLLNPEAVRRSISPRTTGILGVHLWGRAAPVAELQAISDEHGIPLVFDAAHAFGCTLGGRRLGGFGAAEVFSFHATKFFNSFEGGAVVTNDCDLADKLRLLRNFGFAGIDDVRSEGTNAKMPEVCAAMGLVNLDSLDRIVARNKRNYEAYRTAFEELRGLEILKFDDREQNNYQYVVIEVAESCLANRDTIVDALRAENVLARRYFWPCCHRMEPYCRTGTDYGDTLANTERVAERVIVLPTGNGVDNDDVQVIAEILRVVLDAREY